MPTLIDVSHHQDPTSFDWQLAERENVGIYARATYGTRADRTFRLWCQRANDLGLPFGGYHFFRQQFPAADQHAAFGNELAAVGYRLGEGAIGSHLLAPALDWETNVRWDGPVTDAWITGAEELAGRLTRSHGALVIYLSPGEWAEAHRKHRENPARFPAVEWARDHAWWVAHWTTAAAPWSPWPLGRASGAGKWGGEGGRWKLWQYTSKHAFGRTPYVVDASRGELVDYTPAGSVDLEAAELAQLKRAGRIELDAIAASLMLAGKSADEAARLLASLEARAAVLRKLFA